MGRKRIGITRGDQAGIGPEVVRGALESREWPGDVEFVLLGREIEVTPGIPSRESSEAALEGLEEGARLLAAGEIDGVVTAPVSKEGLHEVGFDFPGQTEFFAERCGVTDYGMCLTGENLTVALVTIHVGLAEVPGLLTTEEVVRVGRLLENFCRRRTGRDPRVAVCGLNPHAGENGAFGQEDLEVVAPGVMVLNQGMVEPVFSGPHPADTIFRPAAEGDFDGVLCMYHDQGLIPLKLLDFDTGVNVTLGLPRPRTSPDHGTAFGIAGKGLASSSSMRRAIEVCLELA